jgi:flagellin-like hook-associated protein FlgL
MASVTLSSAVRNNLLALQNTASLVKQTQSRLSTGLAVSSAIDDPVAYFQAKALSDRASDFTAKKQGIDQGISTLTGASNGVTAIESVVKQLQGLVLNAKSATTSTEIRNLETQFNVLRTQINKLASDANYQGLNLINGTGSTLTVSFSNDTSSKLDVNSVNVSVRGRGLAISKVVALATGALGKVSGAGFDFSAVEIGQRTYSKGGTISLTLAASSNITLTTADIGKTMSFKYGQYCASIRIASTKLSGAFAVTSVGGKTILSANKAVTFKIMSATDAKLAASGHAIYLGTGAGGFDPTKQNTLTADIEGATNLAVGYSTSMNNLITKLNTKLTSIRSNAQTLGANIALLNTRLDFTTNYVNTLTGGSGKLTLADLNEEGANLLALQTRQQLGIQALSFAGQSEQAVLGLFR